MAAWTAILIGAVWYLCGPRFFALGLLIGAMEIAGGNIHLLETVAIVVGFRFPAAWAFVLLTKISPGVGLLWFAVRREWRSLAIALGATAAIAAVSFVLMPDAWRTWVTVLTQIAGRDGTWAAVPIPFLVRLPFAVVLVVWGARTDRRWTVPVASMIALPALWYGGLSMVLGHDRAPPRRARRPRLEPVPARLVGLGAGRGLNCYEASESIAGRTAVKRRAS